MSKQLILSSNDIEHPSKNFVPLALFWRSAVFASVVESGGEWSRFGERGGMWWRVIAKTICVPLSFRAAFLLRHSTLSLT
jgi:hypothetical protein